jgi:hypothetical protein
MKKMNTLIYTGFIVSVLFLFSKCTSENEENLLKGKVCDTLNLSYSVDIKPIFETNCYVCHDHNTKSGGFNIEDYNEIVIRLTNSKLINAINRIPGYPLQMPKNTDKLPECTIKKISAWNNAGHPQN